jgi:hypothetical protein
MASMTTTNHADPLDRPAHEMQCMEIWGGNRAADSGVVMPGLDLWVYAQPFGEDGRPADEVDRAGGDVHLVSSCGTGRIARMMLADVSGHGSKVATLAYSLRRLMRRYVNYLDQRAFVAALNRAFSDIDPTGGRFATSVSMTYFAPTARLDVCTAGHPRPVWFRASQRRWVVCGPADERASRRTHADPAGTSSTGDLKNLPLGVLEPTAYDQFSVQLEKGDLVLAYTDAVTESRTPTGAMLGEEGLASLLATLDGVPPERLIPALLVRLDEHRGGRPFDDDLTLLLLRHNGSAVQAKFLRRIGAGFRFLGAIARACIPFGERQPIPWPEPRAENIVGAAIPRIARRWKADDQRG